MVYDIMKSFYDCYIHILMRSFLLWGFFVCLGFFCFVLFGFVGSFVFYIYL